MCQSVQMHITPPATQGREAARPPQVASFLSAHTAWSSFILYRVCPAGNFIQYNSVFTFQYGGFYMFLAFKMFNIICFVQFSAVLSCIIFCCWLYNHQPSLLNLFFGLILVNCQFQTEFQILSFSMQNEPVNVFFRLC